MALGFNPFDRDKAAPAPKSKKKYSRLRVFDVPDSQRASKIPDVSKTHTAPKLSKAIVPHDLFSLTPHELVLSAIKPSKRGDTIIVRFFNPTDKVCQAELNFSVKGPKEAWLVNLSEGRLLTLFVENGNIALPVASQNILSLELLF